MTTRAHRPAVQRGRADARVVATLAVLIWCSGALVATRSAPSRQQPAADTVRLEVGGSLEHEISGGRKDDFQITLAGSEYARVAVSHTDIELVERLLDSEGALKIEVHSKSPASKDVLDFAADAPGTYRIEVEPRYPKAKAGRYAIALEQRRPSTEEDRLLSESRVRMLDASRLYRAGAYDSARQKAERALEIRERLLGPDHVDVAATLIALGQISVAAGDYKQGNSLFRRAISIDDHAQDATGMAEALESLAEAEARHGDYAEAEPHAKQALALVETNAAADDFPVAVALGTLADVYIQKNDFPTAKGLSDRALQIADKWLDPDGLPYSEFVKRAAIGQVSLANYSRAEQLFARVLDIAERSAGAESPAAADAHLKLAFAYLMSGDNINAEAQYLRGLAIREKLVSVPDIGTAYILDSLGMISYRRGDYSRAESLYNRELTIKEKVAGPDSPTIGQTLNNLGLVYWHRHDYPKATELFKRTLEISEKAYGRESEQTASVLGNLGIMAKETGDYPGATSYYERALDIRRALFGAEDRRLVVPLESLGILYRDSGDYQRAEPLFARALAISERAVGPEHPDVARILLNLADLHVAGHNASKALQSYDRAAAIQERDLSLNLTVGSERQKLTYFDRISGTLDRIISFQSRVAFDSREALQLAVTTLLQRKGRVFDAMLDFTTALRNRTHAEDARLVDRLSDATRQLATLVLSGPQRLTLAEHQRQISALTTERDELEHELSRRTAGYFEPSSTVTLRAIAEQVPHDAALVEFAVYRPFDPTIPVENQNRWGEPHYIAYVIRHGGDVQWKELGPTQPVDDLVARFRRALANPRRSDVQTAARALDERIMRPIRALTGDATHLLVAPDGQLDLIPFEALADERGRYLIERYSISYLSSGRELLRMTSTGTSRSAPVIVADPAFGDPSAGTAPESHVRRKPGPADSAQRSVTAGPDRPALYFAPLPGTLQEARAIQTLFPGATILRGAQATKSALARSDAPSILHIATHGFFLQNKSGENPLLRSGLALSGANVTGPGGETGILTALEAANLNLWGTKLVTLSACDTGVGEVKTGEGVYGLRRAFSLAGAETVVMSLWPVSDAVTRATMTSYYEGVKRGLGRGEALRRAQLGMLARKNYRHPFYWASFIQAGDWTPLDRRHPQTPLFSLRAARAPSSSSRASRAR